jgi:glycosyltransferase involved in cell wall biosynthesis
VRRFDLGRIPPTNAFLRAACYVRQLARIRRVLKRDVNPDFVISFLDVTNQTTLLASWGLATKRVATQRVDPRFAERGSPIWEALSSFLYEHADRVLYLDDKQAAWAKARWRRWRIGSIVNPLTRIQIGPLDRVGHALISSAPHIAVAMGRFARQKGFDLLLEAFARIKDEVVDWNLLILGEGELRDSLELLIGRLELTGRVLLPGGFPRPHDILAQCDLFVMSSRYEGLPNAMAEAMACGLTAISFNCLSGPAELITDGINGRLVENGNVIEFAKALKELMQNANERRVMGERARAFVIDKMCPDKIMDTWEQLFDELSRDPPLSWRSALRALEGEGSTRIL